jgi:2-dehydro-3-deoxyphosphogluconate aldolase / (4S)-4-hydroxy-2-oxoglutarate aldolase
MTIATHISHPALTDLQRLPVIGILRGFSIEAAIEATRCAIEAGIGVIEITIDSPRPFDQISQTRDRFPEISIGAGSVRSVEAVGQAADAGATFVVAPTVNPAVIEASLSLGLAVLPGAATPTEIDMALSMGVTAVKVFPVLQLGGPGYVSAILSPLGNPPLVPTGGVSLDNAAEFLAAGAVALGVGTNLFDPRDETETIHRKALAWSGFQS